MDLPYGQYQARVDASGYDSMEGPYDLQQSDKMQDYNLPKLPGGGGNGNGNGGPNGGSPSESAGISDVSKAVVGLVATIMLCIILATVVVGLVFYLMRIR